MPPIHSFGRLLSAPLLCGLLLTPSVWLQGQVTPSSPPSPREETLELPQFTVVGSSDEGWTASSTMSGTRTNVPIQNLPRSVQVLTSEFLSDIGATTLSDSVAFLTGVQSQGGQDAVFDNNTFVVRGMRQNRHYRDGVREAFFGMINDSASVDRVESLRGPSSLLAGVSEPGGMINQISKRPRTSAGSTIKVTTGSNDYLRSEVDVSLPVNEKFALRAVGAFQENETWRDWEGGKRTVGYLTGVYRFTPNTIVSVRAETIAATTTPGIAVPNYRLPGGTANVIGYVPESIVSWDFNPFGPNAVRDHETYRMSADLQHRFNDIFSLRTAVLWSKSDRRDHRPSANATTIYTRYLNPALGNVEGNVVPDEIRWGATLDDEMWHIWTYQADLRGSFAYAGLKHEAVLGLERIETRNWRQRWDTPNSTATAPSTNPNALTRYKFPTAASGAIAAGGWQPAWAEMSDISRFTVANVYVDQTTTRNAVSFTNVISTDNDKWHALIGARYDEGENSAVSGASINNLTTSAFPKESATSETIGLLYRPISAVSFYASHSTSFSGVPSGIDINNRLLDQPEEGESMEIGIKSNFFEGKLGLELAAFEIDRTNVRRQLTDAEQIELIGTTVSGARYVQDAGEEAKGFEAQVLYRPLPGYLISATYTNVDVKLAKTDIAARVGGPIVGRGKQSGSLFQKYTLQNGALKGLYFTNGIIWVDGSRPESISNTTGLVQNYVPSYTRIDFGVGYPFKFKHQSYTVNATVRNVADEKYYEGYQSKGDPRTFRLSVTARF